VLRLRCCQWISIGIRRFCKGRPYVILTEIFMYKGTSPPTDCAPIVRPVNVLQLCRWHFSHSSRLPSRNVNFLHFTFLSPLWGLGVTNDVYLRLVGKRVVDFLLVIIELFSLDSTAEALRANIDWKLPFFNDGADHLRMLRPGGGQGEERALSRCKEGP